MLLTGRGTSLEGKAMAVFKVIFRAAKKLGPTAVLAVIKYGPELRKLIEKNPKIVEVLGKRFEKMSGSAGRAGKKDIPERIEMLREQVTYLYASANTGEMAKKAATWRSELERLQQALPVIDAMSVRKQAAERRKISQALDRISADILAVSLEEAVEDAEVIDDPHA